MKKRRRTVSVILEDIGQAISEIEARLHMVERALGIECKRLKSGKGLNLEWWGLEPYLEKLGPNRAHEDSKVKQ